MAELVHSSTMVSPELRPLDVRKDLIEVANLIEVCFASTMDPDGREYLRQMREFAREESYLSWTGRSFSGPLSMAGYVWEEDGVVVGNLTLIPVYKQLKRVYLIANVAVHPDYRRRGIGRLLTQAAVNHARQHGASSAWLQVRAENEAAYQLYLSLGFIERFRRATWLGERNLASIPAEAGVVVSPRASRDWPSQRAWLDTTYPQDVSWNLPFHSSRLRPSLMNGLFRFLVNEPVSQWSARTHEGLLGVATWEPSRSFADNLWLALDPSREEKAILALLPEVRRRVPTRRPLSINYPAGRAEDAFEQSGFRHQQTLVWMEQPLTMQPNR